VENTTHLKKFFEDVYNDTNMYFEYLANRRQIDHVLYSKWYQEMEKRRNLFADFINSTKQNIVNSDLVETALSKELAVSKTLFKKAELDIQTFSIPALEEKSIGNESHHYLCNGCFDTTLENIYKVLENGAFTVGFCGEKKTDEFKEIVKFYNTLKDQLMRKGYIATSLESNISSKNRIYVLTYDHKKNNKFKK